MLVDDDDVVDVALSEEELPLNRAPSSALVVSVLDVSEDDDDDDDVVAEELVGVRVTPVDRKPDGVTVPRLDELGGVSVSDVVEVLVKGAIGVSVTGPEVVGEIMARGRFPAARAPSSWPRARPSASTPIR